MPRKPKATRKPKRVNYPKLTIPVEFEVTYKSGWKEGALAMTIAGGEVTHAGKKIGSINANAFSGAPVITLNFVGQWVAKNDEDAADYIKAQVQDIIDGRLSPDTDFIRAWVERFSDSNIRK